MKPLDQLLRENHKNTPLAGAAFGLLFPITATLIRIANSNLPFEFSSVVTTQASDSLLWIVDTAPFFLGLFAFYAGRRQDNLQEVNNELKQRRTELENIKINLERRVEERTRELEQHNKELDSANAQLQRRAAQFEALAQVSQSITSIRDLQALLSR